MPPALLTAVLAAPMQGLRRVGWPRALASLGTLEVQGYAAGIARMLQARAWTLVRPHEPAWPKVHTAWATAEGDTAVRDAIAGRLHADDRLELIADGAAGFARREALYAGAERTIDIASYYLQSDDTGRATVRPRAAAVQRSLRVRVLVDRFMTFKKTHEVTGMDALLAEAESAGIALRRWHDPARPCDSNHRKVIVDDRVALVGGRNFADHYRGDDWRVLDLVLEGRSVAALAQLFEGVWAGAAGGRIGPHGAPPWVDHVPAGMLADPMMRFVLAAVGAARACSPPAAWCTRGAAGAARCTACTP
ncbi:MAG: hypothetical protein KIT17_18645 [Rubrivivax sp.]|nr:hypothetical protein [Rubrivivax sp.]